MSENPSITPDAKPDGTTKLIATILRLNRLRYSVCFEPTVNAYGTAISGTIVFQKIGKEELPRGRFDGETPAPDTEPDHSITSPNIGQTEMGKIRRGEAPDNLHWGIDLFSVESVARAINRFCELFEPGAQE